MFHMFKIFQSNDRQTRKLIKKLKLMKDVFMLGLASGYLPEGQNDQISELLADELRKLQDSINKELATTSKDRSTDGEQI